MAAGGNSRRHGEDKLVGWVKRSEPITKPFKRLKLFKPRPGLNWARNRAITEAGGEIIAYTDDDAVVDSGWIRTLAGVFGGNPEVMAVTGPVVPYELETGSQIFFEQYGGFCRGFERKWYQANPANSRPVGRLHGGAGKFGTGTNMAYRRSLFNHIGYFDTALDVGTATNGGGDLDMFFRTVKEGFLLVYETGAVVYHCHRREYKHLRIQITNWGTGFYSFVVKSALAHPEESFAFTCLGLWWLWRHIRRLLSSFIYPVRFPRELIFSELYGSFIGLFRINRNIDMDFLHGNPMSTIILQSLATEAAKAAVAPSRLPADIPVSIVVATYDRPADLRECLRCLTAQDSQRKTEIIVVDNNPASGLTPPVVAGFPGVILIKEPRKGLSYARNKGFAVSKGDIVIATDDDVTMPAGWLETLISPFARGDVMIVTGNILPLELETTAQILFEIYGGLGRGFEPLRVDKGWFESFRLHAVPTWVLGATANAAFRAGIFSHPEIGLIDEALGAGTPAGCSEDTYLFYKTLKAGYAIVYEPSAFVWHKHRREMKALRHQLYNYSKGHVAYHLTTLIKDRDLRAITRLVFELPRGHFRRLRRRLYSKSVYPLSLQLCEIAGNLAGPVALWKSRRRVKREGRSKLYVPVSRRMSDTHKPQLAEECQRAKD